MGVLFKSTQKKYTKKAYNPIPKQPSAEGRGRFSQEYKEI